MQDKNFFDRVKLKYGIDLDKKQDWSFFIDDKGYFKFNEVCEKCIYKKDCGQSFKSEIQYCKKYIKNKN